MKASNRNISNSMLLTLIDPLYEAIGISDFISAPESAKLAAG
jgi:hypothetical protein